MTAEPVFTEGKFQPSRHQSPTLLEKLEKLKGRFDTHSYRLEDYGLRADDLRERFADYVERYDIAAEVSAG
jgi:hypothetical protein